MVSGSRPPELGPRCPSRAPSGSGARPAQAHLPRRGCLSRSGLSEQPGSLVVRRGLVVPDWSSALGSVTCHVSLSPRSRRWWKCRSRHCGTGEGKASWGSGRPQPELDPRELLGRAPEAARPPGRLSLVVASNPCCRGQTQPRCRMASARHPVLPAQEKNPLSQNGLCFLRIHWNFLAPSLDLASRGTKTTGEDQWVNRTPHTPLTAPPAF